ncbi:MAG: HlyD family efflux transporter periplasmic adaptor subunit [Nostocaceae cyanobacterium]|nr:HlyD family efflux transporter periplasmic adaptor subunit [Nostocaceae cyanobacterium]
MENMIGSVAMKGANPTAKKKIDVSDLNSFSEQPPEIGSIYGGTSATATVVPQVPTNPQHLKDSTRIAPATNTANWSLSLQTVLDQPPSALPRRLLAGGMAFCTAFAVWAWIGKIEEVGRGRGQLVPEGEVYKIHSIDIGKIVKIAVKEGQEVKKNQVVASLDTELAKNEVQGLHQQLTAEQMQLSQTQGLLERIRLEVDTRTAISTADEKAAKSTIATANAKLVATQMLVTQLQAQLSANNARRQRLEPLLAKSKELFQQRQTEVSAYQARLQRLKPLLADGAISRDLVFEAEQALRDRQTAITKNQLEETPITSDRLFEAEQSAATNARTIIQSQGESKQTVTEINRFQAELVQRQAQGRLIQLEAQQKMQQMQVEITQLQGKIAETENLLKAAQAKLLQRFLYAPTDGVVSSLNIRRTGEVVQPGQTIAEISAQNAPLILVTVLPNREAGFVKVGASVQVKMDAYPYQNYGIISGKVISISPDAKPDDKLGSVYRVEVALNRHDITENHQKISLKAGQTASAEIIIRHRRIADLLLEPIKQLHDTIR